MSSSSKESFSVQKLNSNNYAVWKFKIAIFMKEDMLNRLTDDPPNPINNEWTKEGNQLDQLLI